MKEKIDECSSDIQDDLRSSVEWPDSTLTRTYRYAVHLQYNRCPGK